MPVICKIKCSKNENVLFNQKSVQDFDEFDVRVFLMILIGTWVY